MWADAYLALAVIAVIAYRHLWRSSENCGNQELAAVMGLTTRFITNVPLHLVREMQSQRTTRSTADERHNPLDLHLEEPPPSEPSAAL